MSLNIQAGIDAFWAAQPGLPPPNKLGIAVSGGSDSTALLHGLSQWAEARECHLFVVTVNHGLRAEAADEAAQVAAQCAALGHSHETLHWTGWDQRGNVQQQARDARYRLMSGWAKRVGVADIALGHTLDDQAETLLMRLGRGSGVDGLSAMAPVRRFAGLRWLRPLLGVGRSELRDYLRQYGVGWVEDPSNDDRRYSRVKARQALKILQDLGITTGGLAQTATRLAAAREVLEDVAVDAVKSMVTQRGGGLILERAPWLALSGETRRRVLSGALRWMSGQGHGPRNSALVDLEQKIHCGISSTLHGCLITMTPEFFVIAREPAALTGDKCAPGQVWDGRWKLSGPEKPGFETRLLGGNGLKTCDNWQDYGLHRTVLQSSPAIWHGKELIAAPLAGMNQNWRAEWLWDENDFVTSLLSH